MNQKKILILAVALFVVLLGGASIAYSTLANQTTASDAGNTEGSPAASEDTGAVQAPERELQVSPDFEMLDQDGNVVRLSAFRGKPVVLNFWASWCRYCLNEMPGFDEAYETYGDEIQFVMLNASYGQSEESDTVREFMLEQGYSFPVFFDASGEGAQAFGVASIPQTVFIDSEGRIAGHEMGMLRDDMIMDTIAALLQ